ELSLSGKAKSWAGVEFPDRGAADELDVGQTGAVGGVALIGELVFVLAVEEIAIDVSEIALNAFGGDDVINVLDGGGMAVSGEPRAVLAEEFFEVVIAVIEGVGKMGGCAAGLAAADRPIVQDDDFVTLPRQCVRDGESGDARADDAD